MTAGRTSKMKGAMGGAGVGVILASFMAALLTRYAVELAPFLTVADAPFIREALAGLITIGFAAAGTYWSPANRDEEVEA